MKRKPTITVAENGNLKIYIPMIIRRMRGRKNVIAREALDGEIPGASAPVQPEIVQALARAFSWAEIPRDWPGKIHQRACPQLKRGRLACGSYTEAYDPCARYR